MLLKAVLLVVVASYCNCQGISSKNVPPRNGRIEGTVLDEAGVPVSGIKVYIDNVDGRIKFGASRWVQSDKLGRFVFDELQLRTYKLYAIDEQKEYPDTTFAFYGNNAASIVDLTLSQSTTNTVVRLGPKAGVITGSVIDQFTRKPVKPEFKLIVADDSSRWISTSVASQFRILVPSVTDLIIEVKAQGYRTWYYNGAVGREGASRLRLAPGEEVKLSVELMPEADPPKN